jgi:beta-glucanase (GH16 family)
VSLTRTRSACLKLSLLAVLLTLVSGQASAAPKAIFQVSAPTTAPLAYGKVPVKASLNPKKGVKVRAARFYVNGKLVTTDRRRPFKIRSGVTFDTRKLPTSKPYLTLLVKYEQVKQNGKITKKSLKKRIRVSFIGAGNVNAKGVGPSPPFGYPLAFSDEFNGAELDDANWNDQRYDSLDEAVPGTPAMSRPFNNAEGAAYGPDNVSVGGGSLNLTLLDTPAPHPSGNGYTRSTGMVNSKNKFSFKYGYVETRAWVPECEGCWPTFWILPAAEGAWPPEIDIFEFINVVGYRKKIPHTVFHWESDGLVESDTQGFEYQIRPNAANPLDKAQEWFVTRPAGWDGNFMGQWHTYGMLWTPDYAEIYFDGKPGARVTGASKLPQEPMYLIYQMAIEKYFDGQPSPAAGSTMKIDYLRVYSNDT